MAALLSRVLVQQLRQEAALAVIQVEDSEGWRQSGVGRVISGTFRREAKGIRIHARLTDTANSMVLSQFEALVEESKLVEASAGILQGLLGLQAAKLAEAPTLWVEYAKAVAAKKPEALEAFVQLHPGFAPAYPTLARTWMQAGRRDLTASAAQRFPAGGDAWSRAELDLLLATDGGSRLRALVQFGKLRGSDPNTLAELGGLAAAQGEWAIAAEQYRALTKIEPSKVDWWNSLGYAEANLNHLPEAVAALEGYRRLAPNEPNVLDSLGEVNYMNRQFAVAAKLFDEQNTRFPRFQNGAGFRKAAFSYYFAGDQKAADLRFQEWLKRTLGGAQPNVQAFQRAMWLARTKRASAAFELLSQAKAGSAGEGKPVFELYVSMIRFGLEGVRLDAEALKKLNEELKQPDQRNEFSVFALLSQPAANLAAMGARIEAAVPQPQLAQLKNQLLAAAALIMGPVTPVKPKVFPLPNTVDTAFDALLLRSRLAVLP